MLASSFAVLSCFVPCIAPTLELAEAVARARAFHPDVQRAQVELERTLSLRVGASFRLPESPHASVALGHRHDSSTSHPASTGPEWTVQLAQVVEVAGQRGQRLREVRWAVQVAQAHLAEAQLQAAACGALDYLHVQTAQALLEVAQAREALAMQVADIVQAKEEAGTSGGLERTLAQVEVAGARAQRAQAGANVVAARQALWRTVGAVHDPSLQAAPVADLRPPPAALTGMLAGHRDAEGQHEAAVQRALHERPLAQALLGTSQGLQATYSRLQRESVPNPQLFFEAQHQQPGQQYFGGGIALPLPIWRRQQGQQAQVQVAMANAALEQRLFAQSVAVQLKSAEAQMHAANDVLQSVRLHQLPSAQSHVDMIVAAWKAGKMDVTRVVQALRYLAEARDQHIHALGGLWQAHIEVTRLLGRHLGPPDPQAAPRAAQPPLPPID